MGRNPAEKNNPENGEPKEEGKDLEKDLLSVRMITTLAGPEESYSAGKIYQITRKRAEELIKIRAAEKVKK